VSNEFASLIDYYMYVPIYNGQ